MADSPPLGRTDLWQYPVSSRFFRLPFNRIWLSLASAVEGFFRIVSLIEDVRDMVVMSLMSVTYVVAVSLVSVSDVVAVSLMSVSVAVRSGTVADACCSIF